MYSSQGFSKSVISWLHSGYSCACSGSVNRRRLRSTMEDVLIDRVDVEKIVLHLPDDAPEHRQVAAEHAIAGSCAAVRAATPSGCCRICVKGARSAGSRRNAGSIRTRACHSARSVRRRHAVQLLALCHSRNALQDARRVASSAPGARWPRAVRCAPRKRSFSGAAGFVRQMQALLDVLQHDRVHLGDRLGRPVIALHQHFACARRAGVAW